MLYALKVLIPSAYLARHGEGVNKNKTFKDVYGWGEAAPLTGLLYCADCGGKMYVHRTNNGKRISQYTCSQYSKVPVGKLCTTQHRINEDVVLSLVSEMLKATSRNRASTAISPVPSFTSPFTAALRKANRKISAPTLNGARHRPPVKAR